MRLHKVFEGKITDLLNCCMKLVNNSESSSRSISNSKSILFFVNADEEHLQTEKTATVEEIYQSKAEGSTN
jgi:hypothetical protein